MQIWAGCPQTSPRHLPGVSELHLKHFFSFLVLMYIVAACPLSPASDGESGRDGAGRVGSSISSCHWEHGMRVPANPSALSHRLGGDLLLLLFLSCW